jgi:hypothetical protein
MSPLEIAFEIHYDIRKTTFDLESAMPSESGSAAHSEKPQDSQRIFINEDEEQMINFVFPTYITRGLCYSNQGFRIKIWTFFNQAMPAIQAQLANGQIPNVMKIPNFGYPGVSLLDLETRRRMSVRPPNLKRRPEPPPAQMETFY